MKAAKPKPWMLFAGLAAGGAALYFLDPVQGPQRRARFSRKAWQVAEAVGDSLVDSRHRLTGLAHNARSGLRSRQPDDRVLEERVRSRMGRIVARPHDIHVASDKGVVTLWGMASIVEARKLVHAVGALHGVKEILDHLELREGEPAASEPCPIAQAHQETMLNWSPARRMLLGTTGLAAAA